MLAAIKRDRNMFIKAKIDPMFDSVRPQVDALLEDILQKTKVNAKKEISNVEFTVQRMKSWFDGGYASSADMQKYNSIRINVSDAKSKLKTQSYFGYDDALRIMFEANERVDEIQANMQHIKNSSETEFNRYTNELDDVSNELEQLKRKKKLYTVIMILIIDFVIFQSPVNVLIRQGIIALIIILFILILNIFLKDTLDWDDQYFTKIHIQRLDIINVIIVSYIVFMVLLTQLGFWEILILLALPFIPIIFKSEKLSDLERKQTKLEEEINALDRRITTTKKSMV